MSVGGTLGRPCILVGAQGGQKGAGVAGFVGAGGELLRIAALHKQPHSALSLSHAGEALWVLEVEELVTQGAGICCLSCAICREQRRIF